MRGALLGLAASLGLGLGCGEPSGLVLRLDAVFDPAGMPADESQGISETNQAVAQTFTVLAQGRLDQVRLLLTDGPSADDGTIRVDVRPTDAGGDPELSAGTAIASIDLDTSTLPPVLVEEYTTLDFSDLPGRQVMPGEVYAIVVEFVSRDGSTDALDIALLLGIDGMGGDPFPDGDGYTGASDIAFTELPNGDDFIFRTYVLQEN